MKITVLVENTSRSNDLMCEHGLSLYIQTAHANILFDAGQTDAFARNASLLGVDLSKADCMVLSHGHYDHGGGVATFLSLNPTAPVYVTPAAFGDYYDGAGKYIGLNKSLQDHPRVVRVEHGFSPAPDCCLVGASQMPCAFPVSHGGLVVATSRGVREDDFCHEQYLIVEEEGERVVFTGCAHKGVLNILSWLCPQKMMGGFHLMHTPCGGEDLLRVERELSRFDCAYATGHCTGQDQSRFLAGALPAFTILSTGDVLEW